MNLSGYGASASGNGEIDFPRLESWNPITNTATLVAQVDKRRVLCRVSFAVLEKYFDASLDDPIQAIRDNRPVLEAVAKRRIEDGGFDKDGHVVLRAMDF